MKKRAVMLLCIGMFFVFLVGCGKEEATSLSQDTVVEDSKQGSNEIQSSEKRKITDQQILDDLTQFIDSVAGISAFSDIAEIDKAWIVRKYHTQVGFNDNTLYNKYNTDYFSRLSDIEKLAKENINPDIIMSEFDDFSSCDGTTRGSPLWISEEQVFGWFPGGGYSSLDKIYLMEAYETDGNYLVKIIDLHLSFNEEYFEDKQPQGTVYSLTAKSQIPNDLIMVGTFTLDQKTNSFKYNFTKDLSSLKQYWYTIGEKSSGGFQLMSKQTVNGPEVLEEKKATGEAKEDDTQKASDTKKIPNSEAAIKLVHELIYKNNPDIGFVDFGEAMHNGEKCYNIKSFSKKLSAGGGSGTIEILYVEINTGKIWSGDTEKKPVK